MSLHSLVRPFAGVLLAALAPVLAGCAEDDFDREAAYPQTIGVTNPRPSPAVQVAQSTTPAVQQPAQPPPPPPPPQGYDEDGAPIATAPPAAPAGEDYADTDPSALTDFRSTLDPYGSWVDDPTYGTVWVPSSDVVGSDFSPYVTAGHWNYDDDYTWVSDYDWGWAPFHYGRWAYAAPYGWEWIPGRVYAGAWVSWRYGWGDWGYVGWAPLGPTWGWRGGTAYGLGFVGAAPYSFCATGDLFSEHVGPHVLAGGQVATIGAHTQPWGTPANPTVNGRTPATPHVNGPPPQVLHIPQSAVAHGAINNRGVMQAQAFAHASTAGVMGARPPQGQSFATRAPYASPYASRVPSYGSPGTSHFGGRLGSGFRGDIASARPTYGPTYGPTRPGSGSSGYIGSRSGWTGYSGARSGFSGYGGGYSGARSGWTPSYGGVRGGWGGGGTSFGVAPGVHPGSASHPGGSGQSSGEGGYSGGGYHGGGGSHGGGGFTGGGSFGGGGFGGGGFRGGGGGGGGRGGGGHR